MRVVQQIPTGSIVKADDWLKIVGSFILQNEILPNSNQVAELIEKCWALIEKAAPMERSRHMSNSSTAATILVLTGPCPTLKTSCSSRASCPIATQTSYSSAPGGPRAQIDAVIYKEKMLPSAPKSVARSMKAPGISFAWSH
jgi:hypothetical protein